MKCVIPGINIKGVYNIFTKNLGKENWNFKLMPVNKLLQITKININNQLSQPITEHKRPMLEIHVLPWDSLKSVGLNLIMGPPPLGFVTIF